MPCKIQIRQNITSNVEQLSAPGLNMSPENARKLARDINSLYNTEVVRFTMQGDFLDRSILVPDDLIQAYYDQEEYIEKLEVQRELDEEFEQQTLEDAARQEREDAERAGIEPDEPNSNIMLQVDDKTSEKGQIGVNKQQLLMLLGPTMYNKPLAQVAVKELLQNSFDAVKARINLTENKNPGKITIEADSNMRTISIKDDGIGMSPDIVKNAFLSIGGTNKEGLSTSERSGGFGLAKVQFLLGSEYVNVITVRDGIKTSIFASNIQLYNDDFIINTEKTNEPNGSFVEVKIPKSYTTPEGTVKNIDFPTTYQDEKYKAFEILKKPLIGDISVDFVSNGRKMTIPIGINSNEETLPPLFSKIEFSWGSADLYMGTEKKNYPEHRVLSSGIYQFNHSFMMGDGYKKIPYEIVINIKPSVASTSEQYPFNNQREGFKNTVTQDISSLSAYLTKYASGEAEKEAVAVFSNIAGLPKSDPNKVLTPEEREKLYASVNAQIEENKKRRIERGEESAESALRKIFDITIRDNTVVDRESGTVEVSKEKQYDTSFKAERKLEGSVSVQIGTFDPSLPQYHNNTNVDYLQVPGASEFFADFGSVVLDMVRFAGKELGYDYRKLKSEDRKFFAGVSIDKTYGGVHIRKIIDAIFINPLAFDVESLEEAVGVALHIVMHEINHTTATGEGASFTSDLAVLYGKVYGTGKYALYEGLFRSVYKKHFETFKKLKNEYDKSTTKNLSQSFTGDEIQRRVDGDVQGNVDNIQERETSEGRDQGTGESGQGDKTGDVILSNIKLASGRKEGTANKRSMASEKTLSKVRKVLEKMGINIQPLVDYARRTGLNVDGVNAVADLVRGIIAVAEGKESEALTEEMVHLAVEVLEQKKPNLVTEMISKIDRFKVYRDTLEKYKNNPYYQKDGKPDIRKIKKEAVGRLLAEMIVYQNEGDVSFPELAREENRTWLANLWQSILDFFSNMYRTSDIDIFEQAAKEIMDGTFTEEDIANLSQNEQGLMFQLSESQQAIYDRLKDTETKLRKIQAKQEVDPILSDTEEASNFYEALQPDGTWKRVKRRVTDRVKKYYNDTFRGKVFTEEEKEFNEFKRENGVRFHGFQEMIYNRYFDSETGLKREKPLARPVFASKVDDEIFNKLETYFTGLINQHFADGKKPLIFSEIKIYDPKDEEAGTIDLLIVDEDGTGHIYDWKFMTMGQNSDDIAWYKKGAYNIQLGRYKEILMKNYGIKQMGRNRAVPILFNLKKSQITDDLSVTGITIGSLDPTKEEKLYLVPFSEETESTGFEKLDKVISIINAAQRKVSKEKVTSDEEKEFKRDRLQALQRAARIAQSTYNLQPLLEVLDLIKKDGDLIINDYKTVMANRSPQDPTITNEELSEFSARMMDFMATAEAFTSIDILLGDLIYTKEMSEQKLPDADVRKEVRNAFEQRIRQIRTSTNTVKELEQEFADKFIGQRNNVMGLLNAQAVVKGLSSFFNGVSEIPLKSARILYTITDFAKNRASREALKKVDKILDIKKRLEARGLDIRDHVKKIYQKDSKDNIVNKVIYKYQRAFYELIDKNAKEGNRDRRLIMDAIDVDAYMVEANRILEKRIKYLEKVYDEDPELLQELILQERRKWDITRKDFNGWGQYLLKRYPKDKWITQEYIDLQSDPDLFELYNLIIDMNNQAKDAGYISSMVSHTFLPFVRKSSAETLMSGNAGKAVRNFYDSLKIRIGDVGYGQINELTGEIENSVPKYYTQDFTKKDDGTVDTSDLSEELFQNLILYAQQIEKYKYLTEIEDQVLLLKKVEQFKNHLETSGTGEVVSKSKLPGNEKNAQLLDDFIKALLYDQKYPLSDSDTPVNVPQAVEGVKKLVNKVTKNVTGKEMFDIDENPDPMSLVKGMDMLNKGFQLKTLGLEIVSGAANMFGGNIQVATQAGKYFSASEFAKTEASLVANRFASEDERNMLIQLMDKFMPLKEDPSYEKYKEAGMTTITSQSFSDILMVFMRYPEILLEKAVFVTLLKNVMVENGKLVNISDYVKRKYPDRNLTAEKYRETVKLIQSEIEDLKKSRSLWSTKKLEDGKLVIPGFDLDNIAEVQRLTSLTRTISRNATGGLADSDINKMSMNVWTRSMMVFKNWIPKLLQTRFGGLRKTYDQFSVHSMGDGLTQGEQYDIGRIRLWVYVIGTSIRDGSMNTMNILSMNDKGIALLNRMYEEYAASYEKEYGEPFTMDRNDFIDMVRNNLRNQIKEVMMLALLYSSSLLVGLAAPDDDESRAAKNAYRYYQRVMDKFISELSFFYNPLEFQRMLSGSAFPAIGMLGDMVRFTDHLTMEITGMDISDTSKTREEVMKNAQPVKNFAKLFPVTKSVMTYGAIFSDDFAKEFDITVQKETRR